VDFEYLGMAAERLPDACLVEVLRCCADDPRSRCSAAGAHSRLHQAAVLALSSIKLKTSDQFQLDSLLLYLSSHGLHGDARHQSRAWLEWAPCRAALLPLKSCHQP
jgi:hypothetical protein